MPPNIADGEFIEYIPGKQNSRVAITPPFIPEYVLTYRPILLSLLLQDTQGTEGDNFLYHRQHSPLQPLPS